MDFLTVKDVKTRKTHQCWGCEREYPAGSTLTLVEAVDQGDFNRSYWCDVCRAVIRDYYPDEQDGFMFGDVRYGDSDLWESVRKDIEDAPENCFGTIGKYTGGSGFYGQY